MAFSPRTEFDENKLRVDERPQDLNQPLLAFVDGSLRKVAYHIIDLTFETMRRCLLQWKT